MLTEDEIRRAVEIAGWTIRPHNVDLVIESIGGYAGSWRDPELQAALAAEMVRMVDATDDYGVVQWINGISGIAKIYTENGQRLQGTVIKMSNGPDRTENTIRAVLAWKEYLEVLK